MRTHMVIFDTQLKPDSDMRMCEWFGKELIERKPDVLIIIGDWWDMPSLSSYDKSTRAAEGRRYNEDIEAGKAGIDLLLGPLNEYNDKMKKQKKGGYHPEMHFTMGNHEQRIIKHVNANPELEGFIGLHNLELEERGFHVHDFLMPVKVDGINYVHYVKNKNSNFPKTTGKMIMQQEMVSTTCGHQPTFDLYGGWSNATENMQWALINGSSYLDNEGYRQGTGNQHFRGIVYKTNVKDGDYDLERISLKSLEEKYS